MGRHKKYKTEKDRLEALRASRRRASLRWYYSHKEEARRKNRIWRKNNPERAKSIARKYRGKNINRTRESGRNYYLNNKKKFVIYALKNKEKINLRRRTSSWKYRYGYYADLAKDIHELRLELRNHA